jgi:metal-sulfur cluster biosynthetic enzyme
VIEMTVTKESVLAAIHPVEDPEMEISLVELGLVYDVRLEEKDDCIHAEIDLTLTSPGCPMAPEIMASVHRAALTTEGLETVHINLVWSPRWEPKIHASEDALMDMGIF